MPFTFYIMKLYCHRECFQTLFAIEQENTTHTHLLTYIIWIYIYVVAHIQMYGISLKTVIMMKSRIYIYIIYIQMAYIKNCCVINYMSHQFWMCLLSIENKNHTPLNLFIVCLFRFFKWFNFNYMDMEYVRWYFFFLFFL